MEAHTDVPNEDGLEIATEALDASIGNAAGAATHFKFKVPQLTGGANLFPWRRLLIADRAVRSIQ